MANQEIRFGVGFDVDKSSLNSLKQSLSELQKMTTSEYMSLHKGLNTVQANKDLLEIRRTINSVQLALKNSFNADLGSTNLVKLNQELNKMDMAKVGKAFSDMGSKGTVAFRNLTSDVSKTKLQLKESHSLLSSMGDTLGKTIKWGISSSIMNNFTGSIQKAYSYTKQLDESLTNIRIVSGESVENMAAFAQQANKAAQELGSTTTAYTDAALIYYQQGLKGSDVTERTNATIKMANVLGESADQVSSYMTAIWNNFDDGSKSLEHYGDVITALGATTASSSEEIAGGVEKFASVAETAGLSYEYATSALATVVATTRQSADTVGTALKTIFARIQGLKLGETLEDGTDLNKYSEALMKVGLSIKDQNGELKDMDDILDEMGEKWQTLEEDQKLALAQAVAGTRQYNQLVALMDNWDFMKTNLETAADATGTLNKQQEIYMESMEAHLNKLKSAQQNLYDGLFDSESFKDLLDVFTGLTNGMASFVKGISGGGNALLGLGATAMQVFNKQIAGSIYTTMNNMDAMKYNAGQYEAQLKVLGQVEEANLKVEDKSVQQVIELNKTAIQMRGILSQAQIEEIEMLGAEKLALENNKTLWEENINALDKYIQEQLGVNGGVFDSKQGEVNTQVTDEALEKIDKAIEANSKLSFSTDDAREALDKYTVSYQRYANGVNTAPAKQVFGNVRKEINNILDYLDNLQGKTEDSKNRIKEYQEEWKNLNKNGVRPERLEEFLEKITNEAKLSKEEIEQLKQEIEDTANKGAKEFQGLEEGIEKVDKAIERTQQNFKRMQNIEQFLGVLRGIGQAAAGIRSLANIKNIIADENISTGEKFLQIISAVSMGLPILFSGLKNVATSLKLVKIEEDKVTIASPKMWLSILGPIAIVVAAIAGLVVAIKKISDIYNKAANAAKEAAAVAEEAAAVYSAAQQASENLKTSIEDYDSAVETMEKLVKGTQEYEEALLEANEAALELIENSNGLLKYGEDYQYNANGVIKFSEGAKERAQQAAIEREKSALSANVQAQANAKSTSVEAQRYSMAQQDDFGFDNGVTATKTVATGAAMTGFGMAGFAAASSAIAGTAAAGTAMGSVVPVVGTLIGAFVGLAAGIGIAILQNKQQVDSQQEILDAYHIYGERIFQETDKMKELGIANASEEYIDSLRDLCKANEEAIQSQKMASEQAAQAALETTETYKDLQAKAEKGDRQAQQTLDAMRKSGGADYQKKYDDEYDDIFEKMQNESKESKKLFEEYAKAQGLKVSNFDIKKDKIEYVDATSGETLPVSKEMVANALAAARANEEVVKSADSLAKAFDDLSIRYGNEGDILAKILGGNEGDLTKEEAEQFASDISEKFKNKDGTYDIKGYLTSSEKDGGLGLSEDEIKNLGGLKHIEEMIVPVLTQIEDKLFDKLPDTIEKPVAAAWENSDFKKGLTKNARDTLATSLENAYQQVGTKGLNNLKGIFNKIEKEGHGNLQKLADGVKNIDWSKESFGAFKKGIEDLGVAAGLTDEDIRLLYDGLSGIDNLTQNINNYNAALENAGKIKQDGSVSPEDWDTYYSQYADEIGKYFTLMADGTHKLTGEAQEFYNIFEDVTTTTLNENIADAKSKLGEYQNEYDELTKKDAVLGSFLDSGLVYMDGYEAARKNVENNLAAAQEELKNYSSQQTPSIDMSKTQQLPSIDSGLKNGINSSENLLNNVANKKEIEQEINYYKQELESMDRIYQEKTDKITTNLEKQEELSKKIFQGEMELAQSANSYEELRAKGLEEDSAAYQAREYQLQEKEAVEDLKPDEIQEYTDAIQEARRENENFTMSGQKVAESLTEDSKAAYALARDIMRVNEGVQNISDNFDDWSKSLKDNAKGTQAYMKTLGEVKDALSDVMNVSSQNVTNDFAEKMMKENAELVKAAGTGEDPDAIDKISDLWRKDFSDKIGTLKGEDIIDFSNIDGIEGKFDNIYDAAEALKDEFGDIELGATLEDGPVLDALQEIITKSGMSVAQANDFLANLGFDATFEEDQNEVTSQIPIYETYTEQMEPKLDYQAMAEAAKNSTSGPPPLIYKSGTTSRTTTKVVGYEPVTGIAASYAMATGEPGSSPSPKLTKLTKTNPSTNVQKPSVKSPSGGKGSGGGSGNSSNVARRTKDPYREVNNKIDTVGKHLDKLKEKQDNLLGDKLLENLKQQTKEYKDQNDLLEERKKIANTEYDSNLSKAKNLIDKLGLKMKIKTDEYGNVLNYEEILQAADDKKVKAEKANNKKKIGKKAKKKNNKTIKQVKNLEDALNDIEKAGDIIYDSDEQIYNNLQAALDNKILEINTKLQVKIDKQEFEREWNDFKKEVIDDLSEDNPFDLGELVQVDKNNLDSKLKDLNSYLEKNKDLMDAKENPNSEFYINGEFQSAKWFEEWKTNNEQILSTMTDIKNIQKDIIDAAVTARENVANGYDKLLEIFDKIDAHYQHQKNMISLIYGEEDSRLQDINRKQIKQSKIRLQKIKDEIEYWRDEYEKANNVLGEDRNQKLIDTTREQLMNSISEFEGSLEQVAELIKSNFELTINNIISTAKNKLAELGGENSWTDLERNWELREKVGNSYLDEVNRQFEMNNLENLFNDAIANEENLSAQQKITNLMEEQFKILEKKDKLTQAEVDRVQKMLDLEIKRIALEEAQENKTNMRLRRDANGNYSYQFVANEEEVNKKQQEYDEASQEYYNFLKDNIVKNGTDFKDLYAEYTDKVQEIMLGDGDEDSKNAALKELNSQYGVLFKLSQDEFSTMENEMRRYLKDYKGYSDEEIERILENSIPNYKLMKSFSTEDFFANMNNIDENTSNVLKDFAVEMGWIDAQMSDEDWETWLQEQAEDAETEIGLLKKQVSQVDDIALMLATWLNHNGVWDEAKLVIQNSYENYDSYANGTDSEVAKNEQAYADEQAEKSALEKSEAKAKKKKKKKNGGFIQLVGLDSGGYTGEWGLEGRIALLHEKELVLNKEDTSNLLDAIKIIRGFTSSAFDGLISRLKSPAGNAESVQQNVQIKAEFPNVKDSGEIEEALNSLVNKASQFAWSDDLKI